MPTDNPYEAAVQQLKAKAADAMPTDNPYEAAVQQLKAKAADERTAIRSNLLGAMRGNADDAAEAQRLERATGIPAPVAQRNMREVRERAALNEYDRFLSDNPEFVEYLRSPEFAAVAYDDLANLSALQKVSRFFGRTAEIGYAGLHDFAEGSYGVAQAVSEAIATDIDRLPDGLLPANPARAAARFFDRKRRNAAAYADMRIGDLSGASTIERGVIAGVRSIAQNLPTLGGAVALRSPRLALAGMTGSVAGQEFGRARDQGLTTSEAALYGLSQATIEYVTERLPVSRLFGDLATDSGLLKTLVGQLVTEIPGEQIATAGQDLVAWAALPENQDRTLGDYLSERPSAAAETLVATLVAVGGQTTAVQAVDRVARRIGGEARQADNAAATAERLQAVNRMAAASKLRERAPERFKQFVEDAAPDSDLYIDPAVMTDTLAQSGIDPDTLPVEIVERIGEAEDAGADVRLSLAEFATHFAGKAGDAIIPHLRTASSDALNLSEADSFAQSGVDFEGEASAAVDAEATEPAAQSVKQRIFDQLDLIGRFNDTANELYAELTARFYETQAARLGVTPEELYTAMPVNIVAESPLAPAFDQSVFHGSPHRFERFDISKIGPGEGAQAFGHGLYFAENPTVAQTYQRALSDWMPDGIEVEPGSIEDQAAAYMAAAIDAQSSSPYAFAANAVRNDELPSEDAIIETLADWQAADVEFTRGAFYEVEIPDDAVARMLDWDAPLSEQPEAVREAVAEFGFTAQETPAATGRDVVAVLHMRSSPEAAAATLRDRGIPGIKYFDASSRTGSDGTRNIVLFDDSLAEITSINGEPVITDQQAARKQIDVLEQAQRGAFQPDTNTIALLKHADLSTFLHESGHFYLEALTRFAGRENAPAQIGDDVQIILDWFGVKDLTTWQAMTLEQRREHHEKFARGFEAYLFEGKAPSAKLQAAFQRFRAWLVNVYRNLRNLNVELNGDVRAVFDRLLATDAEITEAQAVRDFAPIFESVEQAGMTPEQWAEYQATGQQATDEAVENLQRRTLRDLRWLSNAKGRALKRLQKDAFAKREAIRGEVKAEVEREAIFAARRFIMTGEVTNRETGETVKLDDFKLSLEVLEEMYPDHDGDWAQLTRSRRGGVTRKGGLHPDAVAEIFGFTSGDQLVQALLIAEPISDTIEALTDQRMLETYGDIIDAAALERAAEAEIANETRAKFLARELAALRKSIGNWPTMVRGANLYARESILQKRIRDLRPHQFAVAEGKAGRAASEAFRAGDTAQAARHKRSQLVANRLSKAAAEARAEVEKDLRYLARFNKESTRAKVDPEYRDQIDALLERHDLRKSVSNRELDKRKSLLEWIEAQREAGFEPEIPTELLNEAKRQHYRDMTVEQWRGMVDSIRNIEHLGKLKNRLLTAQDERRFNEAVDEAADSIEQNATTTRKDKIESHLPLDRAGKLVRGLGAMHRKFASVVRQMDGSKDGGTLWELLVRPMNMAADREATMREEATVKLAAIFKEVKRLRSGKLYIPEIDESLTREARIAVALNWGTETNRARILDGDKWSPAQAQAVLDTLTREDWQLVERVWSFVGSYWEQIEAKERRVTGIVPEKVEGMPVETKFGTLQGAYWPIAYDPDRSTRSAADLDAEAVRQSMQGLYARATTRRGHTKRRVETVTRPVRKDFVGVLLGHVSQVVHDLTHHEFLIDANRLLRAPAIDQALRAHYGAETVRMLHKTIEDIAKGDIVTQTEFERVIGHLRAGVSVAYMGWSLSTGALQPLGITQSIVRVGPKWIGRGVAQWLGGAARMESVVKDIHARSEFMRLRGKTLMREINEIQNQVENRHSAIRASYFWFIGRMQMVADVPTWLGAYDKAIADGNDEARAVALADQSVIDSQGGGSIKDLAQIQRGGPLLKTWTTFYSYFSTLYNLSAESVHRTKFTDPLSVGRLAVDFLMLYTVPATLGMLLHDVLRGGDDDDEGLAARLVKENLAYLLSTIVGGRELSSAILGFRNRGTAGTRFWVSASDAIQQAEQGEIDFALLKSLNETGGIVLHYPAKQVERTVTGINAVIEDDAPLSAVLFGPPRDD